MARDQTPTSSTAPGIASAAERLRKQLTGGEGPRPFAVGTWTYTLLFGGFLLDLTTPQDLVVAILYNIPIAVSALAVSRGLTGSIIVTALVANLLAAYENAQNIGGYDGIVLANRGLAALSFFMVGAITMARLRAVDHSRETRDARDLAVRERLRVFRNAVAGAVTTDELLHAAPEALSVLLDASGVALDAAHDEQVSPAESTPRTARQRSHARSNSPWATASIPTSHRRRVTVKTDTGPTTVGWLRQPNGEPRVVLVRSPTVDDPTQLLADALDILETLLRQHPEDRAGDPDESGPDLAHGGIQ